MNKVHSDDLHAALVLMSYGAPHDKAMRVLKQLHVIRKAVDEGTPNLEDASILHELEWSYVNAHRGTNGETCCEANASREEADFIGIYGRDYDGFSVWIVDLSLEHEELRWDIINRLTRTHRALHTKGQQHV